MKQCCLITAPVQIFKSRLKKLENEEDTKSKWSSSSSSNNLIC